MGTKAIPREARRITYSTEIRDIKKRLTLSEYQKAVVIGIILGDGNLSKNWSGTNYRLTVSHSIKQKDYLFWKYNVLKEWILTEPRYYEKHQSITFRTISHPELTVLRNIFYRNNKKIIPENIKDFLENPMTIAVWFMDDGNIRKNSGKIYGYYLNTQSFTKKENIILANIFKDNFGIKCLVIKNHEKYRLYVSSDREKFFHLIKEFLIKSMKYKLIG